MWHKITRANVAVILVAMVFTVAAQGEDRYYMSLGPSIGGSWFRQENWSNYSVPTESDRAILDPSHLEPYESPEYIVLGDYQYGPPDWNPPYDVGPGGVTEIASLDVRSTQGKVGAWHLVFGGHRNDGNPAVNGGLIVSDIKHTACFLGLRDLGDVDTGFGKASVDAGTVAVDGSTVPEFTPRLLISASARLVAGDIMVGQAADGYLDIDSSGQAVSSGLEVGWDPGSHGSVTVDGEGSSCMPLGWCILGNYGEGSCMVQNGADVTSGETYLAYYAGSSGLATVDGEGSTWTTGGGSIIIADEGSGSFLIQNGADLTCGTTYLGLNAGSNGMVTLDGEGSTWDTGDGSLLVGLSGSGTFTVQNSADLTGGTTYLGSMAGSNGSVIVDGEGSTWDTGDYSLLVADSGSGTFTVQNGADLTCGTTYLGSVAGSDGSVIVDGEGSTWDTGDYSLLVGDSGNGTFTVQNGADFAGATTSLGFGADSTGSLVVSGGFSTFTVAFSDVNVGYNGQGFLFVENGGGMESARGSIAGTETAVGTATVTGADSYWNVTQDLHVGARWESVEYGQGVLNVYDGGTVRVGSLLNLGDDATLDVTGGGYVVVGSTVGSRLENTLEIAAGGTLIGTGTIIGDVFTSGGVIQPGHSPGTLFIVGDVYLDPNAELVLEFAGSPESGQFDQICVSGAASLAGSVTFNFTGFTPSPGMTYDFLASMGGLVGAFSQWKAVGLPAGIVLNYDPATGQLSTAVEVSSIFTFYNNSAWDNAIAPDKVALRPGIKATLANYTSYDKGINGLMIDVQGLPGTPTVNDFLFRMGNDDEPYGEDLDNPDDDWPWAPDPIAVAMRPGAGQDGADRVTLIWEDGVIRNCWLQVTMLATDATGLAENKVFYVGNAVGESGNSTTDALVNATDEIGARNNPHSPFSPALKDDHYDFNRDKLVNATDQIIARNNRTSPFTALKLITPPLEDGGSGEGEGD